MNTSASPSVIAAMNIPDPDEEYLREVDPQMLRLWNAEKRAAMARQLRQAKLLREAGMAAQRAKAALSVGAPAPAPANTSKPEPTA